MSDPLVFDPATGCCGRVQLSVRWVLFGNGQVWPRRAGIFTYEHEEKARQHAALCLLCSPDTCPADLEARSFWCWEENHYPFQPTDAL